MEEEKGEVSECVDGWMNGWMNGWMIDVDGDRNKQIKREDRGVPDMRSHFAICLRPAKRHPRMLERDIGET